MNPFLYPKSKHRRTQQPQSYSYYPSYKPFLRAEFGRQCVYCRLHDGMKGQDNFGVDHYRPRSLFPNLGADYANLFYACNCCNRRKSNFWPASDQMLAGEFIPNPCDHEMFDHLRYQSARVITRSSAGKLAEKRLMFNDDDSVKFRELMLDFFDLVNEKIRKLKETIVKIEHKAETSSDEEKAALSAESEATKEELTKLENRLRQIGAL